MDADSGSRPLHTRAKTWLGRDQLRLEQEREVVPPAAGPEDEPLGEFYLCPSPLRPED